MKVVVIIPTYNERANIVHLIEDLQNQFKRMPHEMHILVVDDNSPDGTADCVKESMKKYLNVHLLRGEKRGLGRAYIRGMKHVMNHLGADVVMEMDADFSHKPEDVPKLIAMIEQDEDFVIGSRYVKGGKIPQDWGFKRKILSKWGNRFARYIAGLYKIRDCTAGFRAIAVPLLKKIDFSTLNVQGYAFQISLLNKAMFQGAVVKEIPVEFVDRKKGTTKLGLSDIIEFFINVWWIRAQNSKTFLKFLMVGTSGVFVNLFSFTVLMNYFNLNKFIASPISIEVSVISNFLFNNFWTFGDKITKDKFHKKGLKFNLVSFLALGVSYSTFVILSLLFPLMMPQIHQAIGIVPAALLNYFLNAFWTFKEA